MSQRLAWKRPIVGPLCLPWPNRPFDARWHPRRTTTSLKGTPPASGPRAPTNCFIDVPAARVEARSGGTSYRPLVSSTRQGPLGMPREPHDIFPKATSPPSRAAGANHSLSAAACDLHRNARGGRPSQHALIDQSTILDVLGHPRHLHKRQVASPFQDREVSVSRARGSGLMRLRCPHLPVKTSSPRGTRQMLAINTPMDAPCSKSARVRGRSPLLTAPLSSARPPPFTRGLRATFHVKQDSSR